MKAQRALASMELSTNSDVDVKSSDVDYLVSLRSDPSLQEADGDQVNQVGCTKAAAESALKASKGNLIQAVMSLVEPIPRAKSVDGGGDLHR